MNIIGRALLCTEARSFPERAACVRKLKWHGGANPGSRDGRQPHGAYAAGVVYPQVETLRRTQAQFQYEKLERLQSAGRSGVQVL